MRLRSLVALAALSLGGCAAVKDQVLFVTSTSFGVQFAEKPPTASIAYDRGEGYFGPSYTNGAVPPVAAVFGSGGTIFQPQVRQLYTTGAAALLATKVDPGPTPAKLLSSSVNDKYVMFFGTGTTIGLKVGFDPTSGAPDALNFGYRRVEFSLIHLGHGIDGGEQVDVYPSVLASIDTTSSATSAADTGIHIQQFFATGQSAEALASTPAVQSIIKGVATGSLADTLTATQLQQAQAAGLRDSQAAQAHLDAIKGCVVAADGTFASAKWAKLVAAAHAKSPKWNAGGLATLGNWTTIESRIGDDQPALTALSAALPIPPTSC